MRRRSNLHGTVIGLLRTEVVAGCQPGDCLPTLAELAARYDVSTSSIRSALLTLAHEGVVTLRHGSGCYVNAPARPTPAPACVGILTDLNVLVPGVGRFHRAVMDAARQALRKQGWGVRLYFGSGIRAVPVAHDHPEFEGDLQAGRLHGVIGVPNCLSGFWLEALRESQIPWVHLDYAPQPGSVNLDYAGLIREGVQALLQQGCRRLALAGYGGGALAAPAHTGWCEQTFRAALAAQGGTTRRGWLQTNLQPAASGAGWEEFREIWSAHAEKPDGLLVTDDVLLPDIAVAIRELNLRVPDQLPIVTHTNQGLTPAPPFPVTRLEFDPVTVAEALVELMLGRWRGLVASESQITLAPRLIARESVPQITERQTVMVE